MEEKLVLMPYGNHNGLTIYCKECNAETEETVNGYYSPIVYESDKHNRYCINCLKNQGLYY